MPIVRIFDLLGIAQASLADPAWVGMNMEVYVFARRRRHHWSPASASPGAGRARDSCRRPTDADRNASCALPDAAIDEAKGSDHEGQRRDVAPSPPGTTGGSSFCLALVAARASFERCLRL